MAVIIIISALFFLIPQVEKITKDSGATVPCIRRLFSPFPLVLGMVGSYLYRYPCFCFDLRVATGVSSVANQVDCKKMEGLNVMLWTYWQSLFVSTYRKLHDAEMPRAKILETCCVVFDGF